MKLHALPLLLLLLFEAKAYAGSDAFEAAVIFALYGNDEGSIDNFDRANCIFKFNVGSKLSVSEEIFYLNNVDTDRFSIQEGMEIDPNIGPIHFYTVELHGESIVHELISQNIPRHDVLDKYMSPDYYEKTDSKENAISLRVVTKEGDRLMRAWRYIYTHGCHGRKGLF